MKKDKKPKNRTEELWWDFIGLLIGLGCGITSVYLPNSFGEFLFVGLTMIIMFVAGWYYKEDLSRPKH